MFGRQLLINMIFELFEPLINDALLLATIDVVTPHAINGQNANDAFFLHRIKVSRPRLNKQVNTHLVFDIL